MESVFCWTAGKGERFSVSHILLYRQMRTFIDVYKGKVLKLTEEMWMDSWSDLMYMVSERGVLCSGKKS